MIVLKAVLLVQSNKLHSWYHFLEVSIDPSLEWHYSTLSPWKVRDLLNSSQSSEPSSHKDAILKDSSKAVRYCTQVSIKWRYIISIIYNIYEAEVCNSNKYMIDQFSRQMKFAAINFNHKKQVKMLIESIRILFTCLFLSSVFSIFQKEMDTLHLQLPIYTC